MGKFQSEQYRKAVDAFKMRREILRETEKRRKKEIGELEEGVKAALEAQAVVQKVGQTMQETVHDHIAKIVSRCLSLVFDRPYEFRILFEQKRGKTDARLVFVDDKGEEYDPMFSAGGGVVDVAAFALRVAVILLHRPVLRRVLFLDEPFKFVSVEYRSRVWAMLNAVATELDFQFVMVTHIPEFSVGHCIELTTEIKGGGRPKQTQATAPTHDN